MNSLLFIGLVAAFFGLLSVLLKFMEQWFDNDFHYAKKFLSRLWKFIDNSRYVLIPETLIKYIIEYFNNRRLLKLRKLKLTQKRFYILIYLIICIKVIYLYSSLLPNSNLLIFFVLSIPSILSSIYKISFAKRGSNTTFISFCIGIFEWYGITILGGFTIFTLLAIYEIETNIYIALLICFLIFFITLSIYRILNIPITNVVISFPISINLTSMSILVGYIMFPTDLVPISIQILISNIVFDLLSIFITYQLLKYYFLNKLSFFSLPIIVLIDLSLSSIFAISSLFFGIFGTDAANGLKFMDYSKMLFAQHPKEESFYFGPLFWIMHTVFIPIAIYLILILFSWLLKIFLIFLKIFTKRAINHSNPFKLTYTFFALVSAVFLLLLALIQLI